MASPQREDGYTAIANEILEQMAKIKLSPTQYRLLFLIWRYTYGFQRKESELSLTFLAESTGCDKRQLQRELKGLLARRIIYQVITRSPSRVIGFNKNYDLWLQELPVGENTIGETDNGKDTNGETIDKGIGETVNPPIGETDNQERNTLKKNLKKDYTPEFKTFWQTYYLRQVEIKNAFKQWNARRKEGIPPDDMIRAARNYMADCKDKRTETQFIKQPKTFLGPGGHIEEWLKVNQNSEVTTLQSRELTDDELAMKKLQREMEQDGYFDNASGLRC